MTDARVFLTRDEAAQQLRCTPNQVSAFIASGKLRASRPGKRYLIDAADVEAFVDAQANRRRRRRAS